MKKWGGILLIVLGICVALYCVWEIRNVPEQNNSETTRAADSEQKKSDQNTEPEENSSDNVLIAERQEGGTDQEEDLVSNMEIEVQDMAPEVSSLIKDMKGFETEIKRYIYDNGIEGTTVFSLNTVTTKYNENKQLFLLGITGENTYFYVVQDMKSMEYSYEEY